MDHRHVGSLHAADAHMALENARDVYTRRQEGVSIWVVESKDITASDPSESGAFLSLRRIKYTVIQPFMSFLRLLNICKI